MNPDSRRRAKAAAAPSVNWLGKLSGHDEMLGRDDIDAMGERGAGQIGVEQRDDTADAGDAKPDGHVFGPVGHEQADDVTFGEALLERPSGILIDPSGTAAR